MHTVLRYYHGNPQLADGVTRFVADVEKVMRDVPGFVSYQMIKADSAAVSITTCETREACEETSKRAAEFLRQHASEIKSEAPQVLGGDVVIQFKSGKPAMA